MNPKRSSCLRVKNLELHGFITFFDAFVLKENYITHISEEGGGWVDVDE